MELVRAGEVAEAQGVLDAAGCTCPTGEVWRGVFDERGEWYKVPEWVVVEPGGLVEEGESEEGSEGGSGSGSEEEEVKGRREEKGKERAVEGADGGADKGPVVKVRARLSDRGTDVVVKVGKEERVGVLVRRVREVAGVSCFAPFIICGGFWGIHEVLPGYGLGMWKFLKLTSYLDPDTAPYPPQNLLPGQTPPRARVPGRAGLARRPCCQRARVSITVDSDCLHRFKTASIVYMAAA